MFQNFPTKDWIFFSFTNLRRNLYSEMVFNLLVKSFSKNEKLIKSPEFIKRLEENATYISDDEDKIWQFHKKFDNQNIKHIFFNSNASCTDYSYDWNYAYISPTGVDGTYERRLQIANIETVSPNSKHYGRDGHVFWNRFLLNYIITHDFIWPYSL